MRPRWKEDFFWIVVLPTAFIAMVFVFGWMIRSCA